MKSLRILCGVAVLGGVGLAVPAGALERGRNLLANPGFEEATGWQPVGEGFVIDEAVAHRGRRSPYANWLADDPLGY